MNTKKLTLNNLLFYIVKKHAFYFTVRQTVLHVNKFTQFISHLIIENTFHDHYNFEYSDIRIF